MANPSSQVTQQRFVKWWLFWDCYLPTAASIIQLYMAETGSSLTARDSIQQQVAPSRSIWKQKGPRHTEHISLLSWCTAQRLRGEKTGENVSEVANLNQNELLDNILGEEQRGNKRKFRFSRQTPLKYPFHRDVPVSNFMLQTCVK